jgi:hypothetical protein
MLRPFAVVLGAFWLCGLAVAQNKPEEKPRAQYNPFPELAQLKKSNPKQYDERFSRLVLETQMTLASFGYGTRFTGEVDALTQSALREYQAYTHLPITGELDEATWLAIYRDHLSVGPYGRESYSTLTFFDWGSAVNVTGAWFPSLESGEPSGNATIECSKANSSCIEAWTLYSLLHIDSYTITRWDDVRIVAESTQLCGRETLQIGLQAQSVIHVATSDVTKPGCKSPGFNKSRQEVSYLRDGSQWWSKQIAADAEAKKRVYRVPKAVRVKTSIFGDE